MSRTGLVASGLVVVIGLLWWAAISDRPSPAPAKPADVNPLEPETRPPGAAGASNAQPLPPARSLQPVEPIQGQRPPEPAQAPTPSEPPNADAPTQLPAPKREGPVDELKALFASEPRDSAAPQFESKVEAAFRHEGVPAALFKSVLCRQSVCKIELRWAPERSLGYMIGMTVLSGDFDKAPPAIDPVGEPAADGTLRVDVYWPRPAALE